MPLLFALLFIFGAIARFLPHPANMAPIAALGIFAGLYGTKKQAFLLPLAARLISDTLIGFDVPMVMASIYLSTLIGSGLGIYIKRIKNPVSIISATLLGSIVFYLLTNAAVWAFTPMYQKTVDGLLLSYTLALPFFRNTLLGDILYVTLLVGAYETVNLIIRNIHRRPEPVEGLRRIS